MKTSFDNSNLRRAARGPVAKSVIAGCVFAGVAMTFAPLSAHAQNAPIVTKDRPFDAYPSTYSSDPIRSWLDMVSASQAAQPSWMTPLVTVTPRLEQEFRWDVYDQKNGTGTQGNGQRLVNYGGPGGARVELIPAYNWEVILAPPPYVTASGPKGTGQGTGDWPMFLVKYRLLSANKDNGDYIVTAFFQMSDPSGTCCTISNNVLVAQPTLAFGKGWGDFDIQSTISTAISRSIRSVRSPKPARPSEISAIRCSSNTTFQYHFLQYFWPELEVNYTYWPNGTHAGWNQVMLTPGLILGRFQIGNDTPTRPVNLIIGAGYQVAVTPNPVTQNNFVGTVRVTF